MQRLATLVIVAFLIGTLAATFGYGPLLFGFLGKLPGSDKTGHFIVFAVLSGVVNLAFADTRVARRRLGIAGVTALILVGALLDEETQRILPGRMFDYGDFACSALGAVAGAAIAFHLRARHGVGITP